MLRLSLLFFLVSCGMINVSQDYDSKTNFSSLKKYRFKESKNRAEDSLVHTRVVEAVNKHLQDKGYVFDGKGEIDFVVEYQYEEPPYEERAGVTTGIGLGLGGDGLTGFGVGFGSGHRVMLEKLTLRMMSPKSNEILWKGRVVEKLKDDNPSRTNENFDDSIKAMIEKFSSLK